MRSISAPLLGTAILFASSALAQTGSSVRIGGTVQSFDGRTLDVKARNGQELAVALPDGVRITALTNRTLADIKPGEFVGSAAVAGKDGMLHAQEVHIFPETMRGTGEGHRPMAGVGQTMTNAVVTGVASAPDGRVLTLTYPGGEQKIEVDPGARIVGIIPGDRELLKPGTAVLVFATGADDGTLTARSVQAEKAGVKPLG